MEKIVIEMLEAYLNGALKIEGDYSDSDHMRGWFAAMRAVKENFRLDSHRPNYCSPSSEAYWSN